MVAHLDSVTCLAVDPNGLYLLSGSKFNSLFGIFSNALVYINLFTVLFICMLQGMCIKTKGSISFVELRTSYSFFI